MSTNHYPRSLPFRPPTANRQAPRNPTAPNATAKPLTFWLCLAALAFALSVAAGWLLGGRPGKVPPPSSPASAEPNAIHQPLLETLGSLSAIHLRQSYLNIGLVADAVEKQTYTIEQGNAMLDSVLGLMSTVDQQLAKLAKSELGEDDRQDVEHIQHLSALLRIQAAALRAYWLTHDGQQAARYHEARDKAWAAIND
jgi:hypothetical protein